MKMRGRTTRARWVVVLAVATAFSIILAGGVLAGITDLNVPTYKPLLTGKKWVALSGMPVSTTAGAMVFMKGGNAVDAGCAMLAAAGVMSDGMHVGGETQTLIFNPNNGKVYGINGMGVAPTGATTDYFLDKGMAYPPSSGALAAATPGTPGGLMVMLAEFGTLSLKEVLEPAIDLSDGYVLTGYRGSRLFSESNVKLFKEWGFSGDVWVPGGVPMEFGQICVQRDLASTFRKLVDTEQQELAAGKTRKEAIMAAFDRFYKGDIAREIARGSQAGGGLHTYEDLANWKAYVEEPRMTTYHGYEVFKLQEWTQGPVLLQTLNILEGIDLASMERNSPEYIHALYQAMNLAFADRDFYYGDPYFPPKEPMEGLLSKEYAAERRKLIDWNKNTPDVAPGDPYPFMGQRNPFAKNLKNYKNKYLKTKTASAATFNPEDWDAGTTSIQAVDIEGWVCSITPSGGWPPSYIAGRTGVGLGQRMQSFVTDPDLNPFNVIEPGKRPRVTLTPTLILKDGHPFLSTSKRGGDYQEQAQLMMFFDIVHFGMNVQEATESPKWRSFQMHSSFGNHDRRPGYLRMDARTPQETLDKLKAMGYEPEYNKPDTGNFYAPGGENTGNLVGVLYDWKHQTLTGGASIMAERYGISW